MRSKTIIEGFKNSQKFRYILTTEAGQSIGMYITIKQMSDSFATSTARAAVWDAMLKLSARRRSLGWMDNIPTGIVTDAYGFKQVQVDLV